MSLLEQELNDLSQLRGKTVLVVEDDPLLQKVFKGFLERMTRGDKPIVAGCQVFAEPKKLLDFIGSLQDVSQYIVISDLEMPGMNGLETLRRAWSIHADLPMLIATGADIKEARGYWEKLFSAKSGDGDKYVFDKTRVIGDLIHHLASALPCPS